MSRPRALAVLACITLAGGLLRFYKLAWGAPYFHFHIDEHFVFMGADYLRTSMQAAAESPKFFMYSPLPMYLLNVVRWVYESLSHTLDLTVPADQITYMVLGRSISAAFGTATIPLVYLVATRVAGRVAGLIAAAALAVTVLHVRDSHFFSVDASMVFFVVLTWWCALRVAERGDAVASVTTGAAFAGALLCKYSAAFMAAPIGVAFLLSPSRPAWASPTSAWLRWAGLGALAVAVCVTTFLVLDPMVIQYYDKFRDDVKTLITDPLTGASRPIWIAHFADLTNPRLYWFTNLLWWGWGPALEVWSLAGLVWLLARRSKIAFLSAAVPIAYYATAGNSIAPFMRYAMPLAPALAVAAGVFSGDLLNRPRWRFAAIVATVVILSTSSAYAAAYMNVFYELDSRIAAARYLRRTLPQDARVLVEPTQNIVPMGSYFDRTNFYGDYVPWGAHTERRDGFHQFTLDTYVHLYDRRRSDEEKRAYIKSRLDKVDWIVLDDTFLEFYEHLPASEHGVVKEFYRDLFAGKLDFAITKQFKVYPSLFGRAINDDDAELTFKLFDHPRVFVFQRSLPVVTQ